MKITCPLFLNAAITSVLDFHKKIAVEISNCEVKIARQGDGYEVMLKRTTTIKESPRKMDVATLMPESNIVMLSSVDGMEKIIVNVKVLEVKEKGDVGGTIKRDVIVADASGVVRVSVWEGHVDVMEKGKCYNLKNFMIQQFQRTKYLTMPKEGASIILIDDIGVVVEQGETEDKQ